MRLREEKSPESELQSRFSKNENGFAVKRAVVHLSECLNRIAQSETHYDGNGLEGARFEAWRELLQGLSRRPQYRSCGNLHRTG
jgi:hypothetical protein